MYLLILKPVFDRVIAFFALILLSPLLLVGTLLSAIAVKGNPLFRHVRPGLNEKSITIYKLTTMRAETDRSGKRLSNVERIGVLGNFLRKTSIDELPQLFNVLCGDVSLVGPRPLETRYLPHYNAEQRRRHTVLPGITGLAQVSGRNQLSWEEKFKLDVEYVDNVSFAMDMKILWKTAIQIFNQKNVNASSSSTMDPFA